MASTQVSRQHGGVGRTLLWIVLTLALVVGAMFLVVALSQPGDTRTGGFMIAVPCAIVAGLCALGLARRSS